MGQVKICKECGEQKPISDFYDRRRKCKMCVSKQGKQRYIKNREKILKKNAEYRDAHREEINQYFRERYKNNRKEILESQKKYIEKHREEKKEYLRKYYRKNKKRLLKQSLDRQREKIKNDQSFKLKRQVRLLIWRSFNQQGYIKPSSSEEILGCKLNEFTIYLKQTWFEKYKEEWDGQPCHIDHIIPLVTAKTEDDIKKLCHYTNLRLLTPEDNMAKRDKIII